MTDTERIEQIARECHAVYQQETKRQGDIRHHDDYDRLSESVKELDRALARFILQREAALRRDVLNAASFTQAPVKTLDIYQDPIIWRESALRRVVEAAVSWKSMHLHTTGRSADLINSERALIAALDALGEEAP